MKGQVTPGVTLCWGWRVHQSHYGVHYNYHNEQHYCWQLRYSRVAWCGVTLWAMHARCTCNFSTHDHECPVTMKTYHLCMFICLNGQAILFHWLRCVSSLEVKSEIILQSTGVSAPMHMLGLGSPTSSAVCLCWNVREPGLSSTEYEANKEQHLHYVHLWTLSKLNLGILGDSQSTVYRVAL